MHRVEETDHRFYITESTIPNSGLGVFAKVKLHKGDFLEIIGVITECGSVVDQCTHYANRYKFANEPEKEFKNVLIPMGYAAIINQANTKEQQNCSITHLPDKCLKCQGSSCSLCGGSGILNRVSRNSDGGRCVYLFLRDIEPGEELLGHYSKKIGQLVVDGQKFTQEESVEWEKFLKKNLYGLGVLLDDLHDQ